jgi:hypothetical protein
MSDNRSKCATVLFVAAQTTLSREKRASTGAMLGQSPEIAD